MKSFRRSIRRAAAIVAFGLIATACSGTNASEASETTTHDDSNNSSATADSAAQPSSDADATTIDSDPVQEAFDPVSSDPAPSETEAPVTAAPVTAAPVAAADVPPILSFVAPLIGRGEIDAESLAGKPTVFWFWAPN